MIKSFSPVLVVWMLMGCVGSPSPTEGCDNHNPCRTEDVGEVSEALAPGSACVHYYECDDGNPCTAEVCAAGTCSSSVLTDGTPCPLSAGGVGGCQSGACIPGSILPELRCNEVLEEPPSCVTDADCWTGSACLTRSCNDGMCEITSEIPDKTPCQMREGVQGNCSDWRCCIF